MQLPRHLVVVVFLMHAVLVHFIILLCVVLKEHEVQEEHRSKKCGLDIHVQIQGEGDSKVVGIGKQLLAQSRPLLGDTPNIGLLIRGVDIKLNVTTDVELTTGSFNPEHGLPFRVLDPHPRLAQAP